MRPYIRLVFWAILFTHFQVVALDKIVMWDKSFQRPEMLELIRLAADLTVDEYGPYQIESSIEMEEGRAFTQLAKGLDVNLAIGGVTKQRERFARTIYFPLTRGLLGFRLCLINKSQPNVFEKTTTVKDIKKARLTFGLGAHWPDLDIIRGNDLLVVTNPSFTRLFGMLAKGRFHCFLRGIGELEYELTAYPTEQLTVDEHVAFVYPLANFIFISPTEARLTQRLEKGLTLARQNGTYTEHFNKHYRQLLYEYKFYERKLFFLENSNLSKKAAQSINEFGIASFAH